MSRFEPLEQRALMSVSLDAQGCLTIQGTPSNDVIAVSTHPYSGEFGVTENQVFTKFAPGVVKSVRIYGGAGDDRISGAGMFGTPVYSEAMPKLSSGVVPMTVYGGDGNDIIAGGSLNDAIYGGNGNDSIDGRGGADKLYGEADNDTLVGNAGEDVLSGGARGDLLQVSVNPFNFFKSKGRSIVPAGEYATSASGADILELKLDLGSYMRDYVQPIVAQMQTVTRKLQPIVDLYNKKIPIISDYNANLTFGSVLDARHTFRPFINAIQTINNLKIDAATGTIALGRYQLSSIPRFSSLAMAILGGFNATSLAAANAQVDALNATGGRIVALSTTDPFQNLPTLQSIRSSLSNLGLSFPMLQDTTNIAKVICGRNMDLFTYTFNLSCSGSVPQTITNALFSAAPVKVTFGGSLTLGVKGKVGVDMTGVRASGRILDGFYMTPDTSALVGIKLTASAGAGVPLVAMQGVTGQLSGTVGLQVKDLNGDGKVRLAEINSENVFTLLPPLSYNVKAYADIWVPNPILPFLMIKAHFEKPISSGTFSL